MKGNLRLSIWRRNQQILGQDKHVYRITKLKKKKMLPADLYLKDNFSREKNDLRGKHR